MFLKAASESPDHTVECSWEVFRDRIRKIEQLTGRGLTRTEHLAEWWFALRAHDLLTGRTLRLTRAPTGDAQPQIAA